MTKTCWCMVRIMQHIETCCLMSHASSAYRHGGCSASVTYLPRRDAPDVCRFCAKICLPRQQQFNVVSLLAVRLAGHVDVLLHAFVLCNMIPHAEVLSFCQCRFACLAADITVPMQFIPHRKSMGF